MNFSGYRIASPSVLSICYGSLPLRLSVLVLLVGLTGCSSNSTISQITATQPGKEAMLSQSLETFTKAVYWGNLSRAASMVKPESRGAFGSIFSRRRQKEDMVEVKIRNVSFEDSSSQASVVMETQYYRKPTLYVSSRFEKQTWLYSRLGGGWLLDQSKVVDEEEVAGLVDSEMEIPDSF